MRKLVTLAIGSLCSLSVLAEGNTIFSCSATDGTQILVEKKNTDYQFSYGKIAFKNPIKQALKNEKSFVAAGSGFITNSLEMKSKNYSYIIEFVQPRNNPSMVDEPTLYIEKGDDTTTIKCDTSKKVTQHFEQSKMNSGM